MPLVKYQIELSEDERTALLEIVSKGKSPAKTILRANILLASDKANEKKMTGAEIATALKETLINTAFENINS